MDDKIYEYKSLKMETSILKQLLIVGCINIGQIVVGYSVGWSAPVIPKLQNVTSSPLDVPITDLQASWIGSLLYVGAIVGPYITSYLSNAIGRKPCLLIGGFLNIIAYILVVTTKNIAMVYALRVISGLGMGITTVCNLVYVGEIASTHIRGILLTSTSIVGITGTLIVYAVVPYVSYAATGYIALGISVFHVIMVFLIVPESPGFYAMKGNDIKAAKTLNMLGRSNDMERVFENFNPKKKSNKVQDWLEIFTIKSNRMSLIVTFTLGVLQQTSGVAVVSWIYHKLILGLYFFLERINNSIVDTLGWLPLLALIVYFFSYEAGFGTIPNAIVGEMFRPNVRANGSALAITLTWIIGFFLTTSFNTIVDVIGGDVTFWLFAGSCVIAFLFTLFMVPETKGKSLKEIQEMMN